MTPTYGNLDVDVKITFLSGILFIGEKGAESLFYKSLMYITNTYNTVLVSPI